MNGGIGVRDASASRPAFLWNRRKKTKRLHITGSDGKTLCQIENSGTRLNGHGPNGPPGRKVCGNCRALQAAGVTVANRRPHMPRRERVFSLMPASKKLPFNRSPASDKVPFSRTPASEIPEPRLSVLLGEAVDWPPWEDGPADAMRGRCE